MTENPQVLVFFCPGCEHAHPVHVGDPNHLGAKWSWDGDVDKPTFSPSINVNASDDKTRCHSFVRGGRIEFLNDCGHKLKGQTVELPDWPF